MDLPQGVDSKFRFILVAAKRARQLQSGAKPLMQVASKKPTKVAQAEVLAGLVPIEVPEVEPENNGHKKPKSAK
ncbi:MAG: DNA-directed RNA polymerase subunit omega [Acidobacteria bacterium]|nr:MAG: DNA-directed RNA polymerase subunit omega [Acidobacteriota bacterium]